MNIGIGIGLNNSRGNSIGLPSELADLFSVLWTTIVVGNELPSLDGNNIVIADKDFSVTNYIPSDSLATFSLPDIEALKTDDEDGLWYDAEGVARQVTVQDLISQDYTRTLVKYSNFEPYNIDWIGILKSTAEPTAQQLNLLHRYFQLWFLWAGTINDYGVLKDNRALS